jgi:hypothetical protein
MTAFLNRNFLFAILTVGLILVSQDTQGADEKKDKTIPIIKRAQGTHSGVTKATQQVIRDAKTWKMVWAKIHAKVSPKPKLPEFDFTKQMVLIVFMGEKRTGGHSITIKQVLDKGKVLQADVVSKSPPPGGFSIQVLTQPYSLVLIAKSDKKVQFKELKKK